MKHILILTTASALAIAWGWAGSAMAGHGFRVAHRQSQTCSSWHGGYYDAAWGMPVAVVVPPTAESQSHLGWGVGATRVTPIQYQFERNYPGPSSYDRSMYQATPAWPSSTDQFGDYYIRGPW